MVVIVITVLGTLYNDYSVKYLRRDYLIKCSNQPYTEGTVVLTDSLQQIQAEQLLKVAQSNRLLSFTAHKSDIYLQ